MRLVEPWALAVCTLAASDAFGPPPCQEGKVEIFPRNSGTTPWGPPAGDADGSYCTMECSTASDCGEVSGTTATCSMNQGDGRSYCQYGCESNSDCPGVAACQKNIDSDICTYSQVCAEGGVTGWILCTIATTLNSILRPIFTNSTMLVVAVCLMIQYHVLPFFGIARSETLRIFGQGVIVLQVYFDPDVQASNPFAISGLYVFIDRVLLCQVFERLGRRPFTWGIISSERRQIVIDAESCSTEDGGKKVRNKYMDPSYPFRGTLLIFIVQLSLMAYFVYFINVDSASHDINNVSFWKWLVAIMITICVDEDEAGAVYDGKYWKQLHSHPKAQDMNGKRRKVMWFMGVSYGTDWHCRWFFDTVINAICRTLILSTAPIMLSTEEPMDFIKDCLALFFITKLDDFDDAKSLDECLEECEAKHTKQQDASDYLLALRVRLQAYSPVVERS